jgi:hypothetical protein
VRTSGKARGSGAIHCFEKQRFLMAARVDPRVQPGDAHDESHFDFGCGATETREAVVGLTDTRAALSAVPGSR